MAIRLNNDKVTVELRDGTMVERKLRRNRQGARYITYLGEDIYVETCDGRYYEWFRV